MWRWQQVTGCQGGSCAAVRGHQHILFLIYSGANHHICMDSCVTSRVLTHTRLARGTSHCGSQCSHALSINCGIVEVLRGSFFNGLLRLVAAGTRVFPHHGSSLTMGPLKRSESRRCFAEAIQARKARRCPLSLIGASLPAKTDVFTHGCVWHTVPNYEIPASELPASTRICTCRKPLAIRPAAVWDVFINVWPMGTACFPLLRRCGRPRLHTHITPSIQTKQPVSPVQPEPTKQTSCSGVTGSVPIPERRLRRREGRAHVSMCFSTVCFSTVRHASVPLARTNLSAPHIVS